MSIEKNIKQVIIVRKDLKMIRGKEIAQGSHGSNGFFVDLVLESLSKNRTIAPSAAELAWIKGSQAIVCLSVNSETELLELAEKAKTASLKHTLILDEGRTQFNHIPTYTVLSIGPDFVEKINPITGHLKLLVDSRTDKKSPQKGPIYIPAPSERVSKLTSVFIREIPQYLFEGVQSGMITFLVFPEDETRYSISDTLRLKELSMGLNILTGREMDVKIVQFLSQDVKSTCGINEHTSILGIAPMANPGKVP